MLDKMFLKDKKETKECFVKTKKELKAIIDLFKRFRCDKLHSLAQKTEFQYLFKIYKLNFEM